VSDDEGSLFEERSYGASDFDGYLRGQVFVGDSADAVGSEQSILT
jgi:hypothetical protein